MEEIIYLFDGFVFSGSLSEGSSSAPGVIWDVFFFNFGSLAIKFKTSSSMVSENKLKILPL